MLGAALLCVTAGCGNVGYYAQSVSGHWAIVRSAKPVSQWLSEPSTPEALKQRLTLSQQMRDFAIRELDEPMVLAKTPPWLERAEERPKREEGTDGST